MRDRRRLSRPTFLLPANAKHYRAESDVLGDPITGESMAFPLNETDDRK
jgi:hypothetical protein